MPLWLAGVVAPGDIGEVVVTVDTVDGWTGRVFGSQVVARAPFMTETTCNTVRPPLDDRLVACNAANH